MNRYIYPTYQRPVMPYMKYFKGMTLHRKKDGPITTYPLIITLEEKNVSNLWIYTAVNYMAGYDFDRTISVENLEIYFQPGLLKCK